MLLMQAGEVHGYYQEDSCKMIRAASLHGCHVQLVSNKTKSVTHDGNQGNHSVVKTTNLFFQCIAL